MDATCGVPAPLTREMPGPGRPGPGLARACLKSHIPPDRVRYGGNRVIQVSLKQDRGLIEPPKRGVCTGWSAKSRRRAFLRASAVPWEQWKDSTLFVTLTYPDIPSDGRRCKRHLERFIQSTRRYFEGELAGGMWKMEFQRRGSVHFHLWTCLDLAGMSPERLQGIREWVSCIWYEIVGSNDQAHLRAGTTVRLLKPTEDPARYLKAYVGKSGAKSYQNQAPRGFVSPGRFWGFYGEVKDTWTSPSAIPRRAAVQVLRTMRRAIRSRTGRKVKTKYGLSYVTGNPYAIDQWKRYIDQAIREAIEHDNRLDNRGRADDRGSVRVGNLLRRHAVRQQAGTGGLGRHPPGEWRRREPRLSDRVARWVGDV